MTLSFHSLDNFLSGAVFAGYLACALCFARFGRRTGERLFWLFAVAFVLFALERIPLLLVGMENTDVPGVFLIRLLAFALIIAAIIDRNRRAGGPGPEK